MAQIIKHRRGSISALKDVTANIGEFVIATGSIGDLNAPVVFVGSDAIAGGYKAVSKIYQGSSAPILGNDFGSTMDGTPFYSSTSQSLYILDRNGNINMDLSGNLEGNTISGITINNITGSRATFDTYVSSSALNVTGNTQMGGTLNVEGSTTINNNLTVTGTTNANGALNVTGSVNISGATSVTGALNVSEDTTFQKDLYVSGNIYQTGSFYTQGDIVLSGSINIGNSLTGDTINFGGEVNSNILPTTGSTYDLGSSGKTWNNVWAENAHFANIDIGAITLNSLALPGDLTVSGTTTLSGSVLVEDLIQGRVVLVGANGQLVDNENFLYDLVSGFTMNTSGSVNINTSGSLNVYTHDGNDIYMSSSSDITFEAKTDVTITAGDDLRLYSNDALSLRNYSETESITLITNYNGSSKTLEFDVDGNLTIPGGFTGSYADINTQAQLASAAVEDLTDNRIVLAGVGGELEDDANLTFDGTTFKIGDGDFEVDVLSGDTRISGSLIVKNSVTVTGSLYTSHVLGTGSLYLQPDQNDGRFFEIYNSASPNGTDVHFKGNADFNFFGDDTNYLAIDDDAQTVSITGVNGVFVSSSLTVSGSVNVNGNTSVTGSLTVSSGSATMLGGDLFVSGNLQVLGSQTNVNIESHTVDIGDNIIQVNAYSPFQRYAGLSAYDSGSVGNSGSLLWDSTNDYWLFQNADGTSSKMVGVSGGTFGSEASLTSGTFPISTTGNTIGDSLLTYSGTTLSLNGKFSVDSGTGETKIQGNLNISYSGATMTSGVTSNVLFINSNDDLGFISSTDTTSVTDRLLGYNTETGNLEFSRLIDGGQY